MIRIVFYSILTLGLIIITNSCTTKEYTSEKAIVKEYFQGLNTGDFSLISKYISDSITTTEMDFVLSSNSYELYRQFQWDSVFTPNYSIISLSNDSTGIVATIAKTCKRIEFLQDTAMVYITKIDFKRNQIVKISTTEYVYMDLAKWIPRRDSLSAWIDRRHPEISGFVYDMTPRGAQNYLTAILLYENEK